MLYVFAVVVVWMLLIPYWVLSILPCVAADILDLDAVDEVRGVCPRTTTERVV